MKNEKNNPIGDDLNPNLKEAIKKKKTLKNDTKDLDAQLKDLNNSVTFLLRKVSNSGKSISEKYTVLKIFRGLLYFTIFLLFLGAAFFLQFLQANDMLTGLVPKFLFIYFFIFQVFCVYCGIRIIDFLFDLNEHK